MKEVPKRQIIVPLNPTDDSKEDVDNEKERYAGDRIQETTTRSIVSQTPVPKKSFPADSKSCS